MTRCGWLSTGSLALLLALHASGGSSPGPDGAQRSPGLLVPGPADSLVPTLTRMIASRNPGPAAYQLGLLHYARGDYPRARAAFARAQGSLPEPFRAGARCWEGRCWIALKDPGRARAAVNPLLRTRSPWRNSALLIEGLALELEGRPAQALDVYERLTEGGGRESEDPTALARVAVLYRKLQRPDRSAQAYERLIRRYPRSVEAVGAQASRAALLEAGAGGRGEMEVQIGSFTEPARARALADSARRSGFPRAQVVMEGGQRPARHLVRLGVYPTRSEAVAAGEAAQRVLGTEYWLVKRP